MALARHASALHQAGVGRINVSLDSLHAERFREITHGKLDRVLNGLMAAKRVGFAPIKINMVVMKGIKKAETASTMKVDMKPTFHSVSVNGRYNYVNFIDDESMAPEDALVELFWVWIPSARQIRLRDVRGIKAST